MIEKIYIKDIEGRIKYPITRVDDVEGLKENYRAKSDKIELNDLDSSLRHPFEVINIFEENASNLDSLTEIGYYIINDINSATNTNQPSILVVDNKSNMLTYPIRQTMFNINLGIFQYRFFNKNNNKWEDWKDVEIDGSKIKPNTVEVNDIARQELKNEDLNDIKTPNFTTYWASSTNTCTNKPVNNTDSFWLHVWGSTEKYITQMFGYNGSYSIYIRHCKNGVWYDWKQIITSNSAPTDLTWNVQANDFNALTKRGIYFIDNNYSSNKNAISFLIVHNYLGNNIMQTWYDNQGEIRCRYTDNGGNTWTNWKTNIRYRYVIQCDVTPNNVTNITLNGNNVTDGDYYPFLRNNLTNPTAEFLVRLGTSQYTVSRMSWDNSSILLTKMDEGLTNITYIKIKIKETFAECEITRKTVSFEGED